jgi:hypothetical protein
MALEEINEKSAARLTVAFLDEDEAPIVPTAVTYEVHDEDTGVELRAATPMSLASSVDIILSDTDTQMNTTTKSKETHVVTVKATFAGGLKINSEYRFRVLNLEQVT